MESHRGRGARYQIDLRTKPVGYFRGTWTKAKRLNARYTHIVKRMEHLVIVAALSALPCNHCFFENALNPRSGKGGKADEIGCLEIKAGARSSSRDGKSRECKMTMGEEVEREGEPRAFRCEATGESSVKGQCF